MRIAARLVVAVGFAAWFGSGPAPISHPTGAANVVVHVATVGGVRAPLGTLTV